MTNATEKKHRLCEGMSGRPTPACPDRGALFKVRPEEGAGSGEGVCGGGRRHAEQEGG